MFRPSLPKLNVMAKSSTRRVTIYINGKEVEASVKQIRSEMNKLVNEQNRMVIGSDEYIIYTKKATLMSVAFFVLRRGRDSNSRIGYPIDSLANCWFQPLTHLSRR